MIKDCRTQQDYDRLLQDSHEHAVFLLKHSTRCPISSAAWRAFQRFDEADPSAEMWKVLVVEDRALSSEIAHRAGIQHKSPQLLLFSKGKVVWNDSHWALTEEAMQNALRGILDT
jgi:monothiol bacilliredoxin